MEIIKKGNVPTKTTVVEETPKYKFIAICEKCGCEFSYTKKDSYMGYNAPNYSGLIGRIVDCPCCGHQMFYNKGKKVNPDGSALPKFAIGNTVYYFDSTGIVKSKVVNVWKYIGGYSYVMKGYGANDKIEKDLFPTLDALIKHLKDNLIDNTID